MPDPQAAGSAVTVSAELGQHYQHIKAAIPPSLITASPSLRASVRQVNPVIPGWFAATGAEQKNQLKACLEASFKSHAALDQSMDKVQDINDFAKPLLEAALKAAGHELDVEQTCLRLYCPVEDAFGVRTGGFRAKTLSLLQAALNNFEEPETRAGFFNSASGFITAPDAEGHFERHATSLKIDVFTRLCRDLDLGKQYQAHLTTFLRPAQTVSQNLLRERFVTAQKDGFKAAAYLALLKGDIGQDDYALLLRVASGERNIMLGDRQIWYRRLCLMNLRLQGCVIIDPCVKYRYASWFIAYIPDDPEHPIKRYESFAEFRAELTRQMTVWPPQPGGRPSVVAPTNYQRFFARFVARKDLAYYYRRFTELVPDAPPQSFALKWLRSEQGQFWSQVLTPQLTPITSILGDPAHRVRIASKAPNLNINADSLKGLWVDVDLWDELYEGTVQRLFDDALTMAVPTAMADANNRSRRLAHYMSIGLFALNLVSMVVPPLGTVMAVAMAAQVLYEVLEGAIELSEGEREAGWSHIGDVMENLAMLAVGGTAFHVTVSPFIEGLKSIKLPSGEVRLWKPDIQAYALEVQRPTTAVPDEAGLRRVQETHVLDLDGKRYALKADPYPGQYRIQHPRRPDAYQPAARHNGSGAWTHEAERPLEWEGPTLMRRLGRVVEGLDDAQLEAIRRVCDIDHSVLRRLHVESEPTPATLLDTVRQFRAYDDVVRLSEQIFVGQLSPDLAPYAASLMVEMPRWPVGKAIEVFEGEGPQRVAIQYGDTAAPLGDLISISRADLMNGQLPARVVAALSDQALQGMLGQHLPPEPRLRSQRLQARLGDYAQQHRARLFRSRYSERVVPSSVAVQVLQRDFQSLPTILAQELLSDASAAELQALTWTRKIPLRLAQKARELQATQRLTKAYEGLYLEALASPDTETLVLNTLETLPGWKDGVRIEVREDAYDGELRAHYGPVDAPNLKVLVRISEGRYQAFDGQAGQLHGVDTLYEALQHALTDAHRRALGLPHVGQGVELKLKILQHALPRDRLRERLGMRPAGRPFFKPPQALPGGRRGYPLSGRAPGTADAGISQRIRALYPDFTAPEVAALRAANNPFNDAWLKTLEREYRQLDATLQTWLATPIRGAGEFGSHTYRSQLQLRSKIARVLIDAWKRIGPRDYDVTGNEIGQKIESNGVSLRRQLASLPPLGANFDHVTSLELSESGLTDTIETFLGNFRGLRTLNLELNHLTRLPLALEHMPRLKVLSLAENRIVLDPEAVGRLKQLKRLWLLELDSNPLGLAPDISRMAELTVLFLTHTGLDGWPTGLFAKPRSRSFNLDLSGNPITQLPEVAPGSDRAQILARTRLDREQLPARLQRRLRLYIESVGLDPQRRFPPRGTQDSVNWKAGLSEKQWQASQPLWNALEESPGAEPFFNEIRKLSESADASPAFKADLTAKVWRMLGAMFDDIHLRDRLFEMASAPTTCVDAGAQLFNAMGIEVLLSEAYGIPREALVKVELLALAKGKSRLDELGRIAHARVSELVTQGRRFPEYDEAGDRIVHRDAAGNPVRSIDEVEIHLAYATRLADRLDLPWQSRSMKYKEPDVTPAMIEAAYNRVLALERGDLLRDRIVHLEFWTTYLQRAMPDAFSGLNAKIEALNGVQAAMSTWFHNGSLSASARQRLTEVIRSGAQVLGKPQAQFPTGREMTDEEFTAMAIELRGELSTTFKTLTDQAMGRLSQPLIHR